MQDGMKRKRGGVAIEKRDPVLASQALVAYAETNSLRKAGALTGLGKDAVAGIVERNPEEFRQVKTAIARRHFHIANRCLEELEQVDLSTVAPAQLSVMSGIHTQRGHELIAKEPPMPFDPQLARRVVEESAFWRAELQRRSIPLSVIDTEDEAALPSAEAGEHP